MKLAIKTPTILAIFLRRWWAAAQKSTVTESSRSMEKRKISLNSRLNVLVAVCFIPLLVIAMYLVIMLYRFSERYDETVQNITTANAYNLDLKEQLDYTMYIIVVNSERAEELVDIDAPQQLIGQAREDFKELYDSAGASYARNNLQRIQIGRASCRERV